MKNTLSTIVVIFCCSFGFAQQTLPYQAILKDVDGKPVPNTQIQLRFTIKNQLNAIKYQETQSPTTDNYGWFEVLIGNGVVLMGSMASIDWNNDVNTLVMECSENGGNYEEVSSIVISGSPFTFNGDNNPANDITAGSPAGGDLLGTYPNPTVKNINGKPVSGNTPGQGDVLKWNGSEWTPSLDLTSNGGGNSDGVLSVSSGLGIEINNADPKNPIVSNKGDLSNTNEIQSLTINGNQLGISSGNTITLPGGDNWGSEIVNHNATLSGDGTPNNPLKLAQQGATNGQVLKYNTSSNIWSPADDNGPDNWGAQIVQKDGTLAGDGTINNPLKLAQQGATNGQVLKYNSSSNTWAPAAENGPDNWGAQVVQKDGTLAGDGTSNNPLKLAQQGATNGQVLKYNASSNSWTPAVDNGMDNWGTQVVQKDASLTGDGTSNNPLKIAAQGAADGQVLKYNSQNNSWTPLNDNWGNQTALTDVTLSGNGSSGSPLKIAQQGATNGQVLLYSAQLGTWKPESFAASQWLQTGNHIYYTAGNVGIGTTSPGSKLMVDGNITPETGNKGDLGTASLPWEKTFTSYLHIGSNVIFSSNSNGATLNEDLRPTASATYNLGGTSSRWNTIYAQNPLNTPSDKRLKHSINNLKYGLKEVLELQPKSYVYNNDANGKIKLGLIAQEVKTVIPELVEGDETKEMLSMSYEYLIPVLINAIKEQQKLIHELEHKNGLMQKVNKNQININNELQARLDAVEKTISALQKQ